MHHPCGKLKTPDQQQAAYPLGNVAEVCQDLAVTHFCSEGAAAVAHTGLQQLDRYRHEQMRKENGSDVIVLACKCKVAHALQVPVAEYAHPGASCASQWPSVRPSWPTSPLSSVHGCRTPQSSPSPVRCLPHWWHSLWEGMGE